MKRHLRVIKILVGEGQPGLVSCLPLLAFVQLLNGAIATNRVKTIVLTAAAILAIGAFIHHVSRTTIILLSNKPLALAPFLKPVVVTASFAIVVFYSSVLALLALVVGSTYAPLTLLVALFVPWSMVQLLVLSNKPGLLAAAIAVVCMCLTGLWVDIADSFVGRVLALAVCTAWLRSLFNARRDPLRLRQPLKSTQLQRERLHSSAQAADLNFLDDKWQGSPRESLLTGYSTSLRALCKRSAIPVVGVALLASVLPLIKLLTTIKVPEAGPGSVFILYLLCTMGTAHAARPARARLLWLRIGGSRAELWHVLERVFWKELAIEAALLLAVIGLSALWAKSFLVDLCLLFTAGMLLKISMYYLATLVRCKNWRHHLLTFVSYLVVLALLLLLNVMGLTSIDFILIVGITLLTLCFLLRLTAQQSFLRIDWLKVRLHG
jgi:hypothetical protein